jgi:myosin heavy subunit
MEKAGRKGNVVTVILTLVFFIGCVVLVIARQSEHSRHIRVQEELARMTRLQGDTDALFRQSEIEKNGLKSTVVDKQKQLDDISSKLEEETKAKEDALQDAQNKRQELEAMKSALASAEQEKTQLQEKATSLENKYKGVENELTVVRMAKESLERKVEQIESGGTSGPDKIVVKGQVECYAQVLNVNRRFNFIIMDIGRSSNFTDSANTFSVYLGDKFMGDLEMRQVQELTCAASWLPGEIPVEISKGVRIRLRSTNPESL